MALLQKQNLEEAF